MLKFPCSRRLHFLKIHCLSPLHRHLYVNLPFFRKLLKCALPGLESNNQTIIYLKNNIWIAIIRHPAPT